MGYGGRARCALRNRWRLSGLDIGALSSAGIDASQRGCFVSSPRGRPTAQSLPMPPSSEGCDRLDYPLPLFPVRRSMHVKRWCPALPPRALPHLPASCRNLVLDAVSSLYSLHLPFSHSFTCRSRVEVARALKRCLVALSAQQGTNIWLRIRAKQIPDLGGVSGAEAYRHRIGTFASMRSLAFSIFLIPLASRKDQKTGSGSSGQGVFDVANSSPKSLVLRVLVTPGQTLPCRFHATDGRLVSDALQAENDSLHTMWRPRVLVCGSGHGYPGSPRHGVCEGGEAGMVHGQWIRTCGFVGRKYTRSE
ncbi:hypothetical protein FA13DRAFT_1458569 [Coprinellus micaceus]|uniref:Uncharacterized protein n=1 Tax=Coprinellus micaceus TaxID=71717 RepID=A0A4Y7SP88_COPMI|nr:hypothetical protein FA13DRAFT_1458569 [Coprinellus micaceus]